MNRRRFQSWCMAIATTLIVLAVLGILAIVVSS